MPPRRRQPAKAVTYTESSSTSSLSSPSDTDSGEDSAASPQPTPSSTPRTRARTTRQTRRTANEQPSVRLRTRLTRGKRPASKELTPPPGPAKRRRARRAVDSPSAQTPRMRTRNGRGARQVVTDTVEEDSGTESEVESAMDAVEEPEESDEPEESIAAEADEGGGESDNEGENGGENDDGNEGEEDDVVEDKDIIEQPEKEEKEDEEEADEGDRVSEDEGKAQEDVASEQGNKSSEDDEQDEDASKAAPAKRRRGGRKPRGGSVARKIGRGRPAKKAAAMVLESDSEPTNLDALGGLESDLSSHDGDSTTTSLANMTRRQRARLTHDYAEELMELPTEAKKTKFSVEEMALRKSEQARRRKFQSMQREEQLKNDTINRLLNKQTSKGRNKVDEPETRSASEEPGVDTHDMIRYRQKCAKVGKGKHGEPVRVQRLLQLPKNTAVNDVFPMSAKDSAYPPQLPKCAVKGCDREKKYRVNDQAACSLEHWRVLKAAQ
ncbi:INO80 complex subunit B [Linderina pennispora]|nr:INO80 complex subunit B [Linderina pennispora]